MWDGPDPLWETTCQNWFGSRLRSMWSMWFHTHTSHLHLNRLRYWLEMELSEPDYKSTESAVREPSIHSTSLLLSHFSRVRLCATPQTAAHQAPPSLGFSRQEYWSGVPLLLDPLKTIFIARAFSLGGKYRQTSKILQVPVQDSAIKWAIWIV